MLKVQIHIVWAFLTGALLALYVAAVTFNYFPSFKVLFYEVGTECGEYGVSRNPKTDSVQNSKGTHSQNEVAEREKQKYECLVAAYTQQLAVFTKYLALATAILAFVAIYQTRASIKRDKVIERAYLVGGGGAEPDNSFLDVANYGKTPASLKAFAIEICERSKLPDKPKYLTPAYKREVLIDEIAPGQIKYRIWRKAIPKIEKPVVYGRFWYRDIWNKERYFSFILSIGEKEERGLGFGTHPDVSEAGPRYTAWT